MLRSRSARRQLFLYVGMLAITLLMLAFSASGPVTELRHGVGFAMAPIQNVCARAARTVSSFFATLGEIDQLRQENQALNTQINELATENRALDSLRVQNQQLTDVLNVRSSIDFDSVAAEVISRRITEQEQVISLDRGADAGIEQDDPVIGGGGALVGQVVEVGPNYSRVLLISDQRMKVVGLIETSRGVGTIEGQLERPMLMTGIPAADEVNLGEAVVTAGIELAEGHPLALSEGPPDRHHRRCPALARPALPDRAGDAGGTAQPTRVRARDHQLPGWPAGGRGIASAKLDALVQPAPRPRSYAQRGFFVGGATP